MHWNREPFTKAFKRRLLVSLQKDPTLTQKKDRATDIDMELLRQFLSSHMTEVFTTPKEQTRFLTRLIWALAVDVYSFEREVRRQKAQLRRCKAMDEDEAGGETVLLTWMCHVHSATGHIHHGYFGIHSPTLWGTYYGHTPAK